MVTDVVAAAAIATALDSCRNSGAPIRVVVGDGAEPQAEIKSRGAFLAAHLPSSNAWGQPQEDAAYWNALEGVRLGNSWEPVGETYFLLGKLLQSDMVDCVITTNYDMVLDHHSLDWLNGKLTLNPIAGENPEQWGGFIGTAINPGCVPYYKTHGTLGHVRFDRCEHIFSAPPFRVARVDPSEYPHERRFHESLKKRGIDLHIPDMRDEGRSMRASGGAQHLTDTNFSRFSAFERVVNQATVALTSTQPGMILCLGFRGAATEDGSYWEELVDPVVDAASEGCPVVVLLAAPDVPFVGYLGQQPSVLANRIDALGMGSAVSAIGNIDDLLREGMGSAPSILEDSAQLRLQYDDYLATYT